MNKEGGDSRLTELLSPSPLCKLTKNVKNDRVISENDPVVFEHSAQDPCNLIYNRLIRIPCIVQPV